MRERLVRGGGRGGLGGAWGKISADLRADYVKSEEQPHAGVWSAHYLAVSPSFPCPAPRPKPEGIKYNQRC